MKIANPVLTIALASVFAGCGGHVIHSRGGELGQKAAEAAQVWADATGAPIFAVEGGGAQDDRIEIARPGELNDGISDVCGRSLWAATAPTVIRVDPDCAARNSIALRDVILHEMGHWLGFRVHLPADRVGIMNLHGYDSPNPDPSAPERGVTPSDVAAVCETLDCGTVRR